MRKINGKKYGVCGGKKETTDWMWLKMISPQSVVHSPQSVVGNKND